MNNENDVTIVLNSPVYEDLKKLVHEEGEKYIREVEFNAEILTEPRVIPVSSNYRDVTGEKEIPAGMYLVNGVSPYDAETFNKKFKPCIDENGCAIPGRYKKTYSVTAAQNPTGGVFSIKNGNGYVIDEVGIDTYLVDDGSGLNLNVMEKEDFEKMYKKEKENSKVY